jgi:hypothetical protein
MPLIQSVANYQTLLQSILDQIPPKLDLELFGVTRHKLWFVDENNARSPHTEAVDHSLPDMVREWSPDAGPQSVPVHTGMRFSLVVDVGVGVLVDQGRGIPADGALTDRFDLDKGAVFFPQNVTVGSSDNQILGGVERYLGVANQISAHLTTGTDSRACVFPVELTNKAFPRTAEDPHLSKPGLPFIVSVMAALKHHLHGQTARLRSGLFSGQPVVNSSGTPMLRRQLRRIDTRTVVIA